jgi:hypothetical protein
MPDDMGTFRVDVEIENPARQGERRTLTSVLVDTGAELSWVPAEALDCAGHRECGVGRRPSTPHCSDGEVTDTHWPRSMVCVVTDLYIRSARHTEIFWTISGTNFNAP